MYGLVNTPVDHVASGVGEATWTGTGDEAETERLVEWCVEAMESEGVPCPRVIDLCTGAGAISMALAHELVDAEVHAVELDPVAVASARRNADAHVAAGDRTIILHHADITALPRQLDGTFDLVVSNPLRVPSHEIELLHRERRNRGRRPSIGGVVDGLNLVRAVERVASRLLKEGGVVVVASPVRQGRAAPAVFTGTGRWMEVAEHGDGEDGEGFGWFVSARRPAGIGTDGPLVAARRAGSLCRSGAAPVLFPDAG